MEKFITKTLFILFAQLLLSTVLLANGSFDRYLGKIDGSEKLPRPVQTLLYEEQILHNKDLWGAGAFDSNIRPEYVPEARPRFPLSYFLIPADDAKFLKSTGHNPEILRQISKVGENGGRYYKLFVHPESYEHYRFMEGHYEFVGPEKTEFLASPTSSYRSLVVWDKSGSKPPFIAKVSLDKNVIGSIDRLVSENEVERSITNQEAFEKIGKEKLHSMGVDIFPETAGLLLEKNVPGRPEKLGGQLIREIPSEVISGSKRWISFSAMMSPNRQGRPMVMDVIRNSGLSTHQFIETFLIEGYMQAFEELSLKKGINFEPHSQNLCFETTSSLRPTGNWIIRDFGGVWPDMATMIKSNGPVDAYVRDGNASKLKFEGGHSNAFSSYAFFYKRQVFDMLLKEIAKYDRTLTAQKIASYKTQIDRKMAEFVGKYLLKGQAITPTMENYRELIARRNAHTQFEGIPGAKVIQLDNAVKDYIESKKSKGEWVQLTSTTVAGSRLEVNRHGAFLVSNSNILLGFGIFNPEEYRGFNQHSEVRSFLENQTRTQGGIGARCLGVLRSLFGQ